MASHRNLDLELWLRMPPLTDRDLCFHSPEAIAMTNFMDVALGGPAFAIGSTPQAAAPSEVV
jgi:hypothetical protein